MSRHIKFSAVIEDPQTIEVGSTMSKDGRMIVVTSISKVEFVNDRAVLVNGKGTI